MLYCFMLMRTTEPGTKSVFDSMGTKTSYEMKIIYARSKRTLLEKYIAQMSEWIKNHPYHSESTVAKGFRYANYVLERKAYDEIEEVFYDNHVEVTFSPEVKSVITATYYAEDWIDFYCKWNYESSIKVKIPSCPQDFDSNAIESREAYDMLRGEHSDEQNCWKRLNWKLMYHKRQVSAKEVEAMNVELERIAHELKINDHELKYFKGLYE